MQEYRALHAAIIAWDTKFKSLRDYSGHVTKAAIEQALPSIIGMSSPNTLKFMTERCE